MTHHDTGLNQDVLTSVIGLIYDTVDNPDYWPELVNTLEIICIDKQHLKNNETLFDSHFQRALNFNQRLQHLEQNTQIASSIINRLPIGIIATEYDATIKTINTYAEELLQQKKALFIKDNKITCASKRQTQQLQQMIHDCIYHEKNNAGNNLQIQDTNNTYSLWVQPTTTANKQPFATIYIASSQIKPEYSVCSLQSAFGLTHAEAKLVKKITNGSNNLNEAAASLNISVHTARTQIKKVFEKTSTNNQLELVKKVLTSPEMMVVGHGDSHPLKEEKNVSSYIKLFDGRTLAYREYGDANGYPILYFHSIVGGELECDHDGKTLLKYGIRLIAPSRPGFGYSTQHSKHSLLQFTEDIRQLLEHLHIQTCAILSYSLGSLYGFACCKQMPEIICHHSTVSPPGLRPNKKSVRQMTDIPFFRVFTTLAITAPNLLATSIRMTYKLFSYDIESFWDKTNKYLCDSDREAISKHKNKLKLAFAQGNQQSGYQSTQEMMLWVKPWGFQPETIQTPTTIWHGKNDKFTFPSASQSIENKLQHAELKLIVNGGHYILYDQWENIFYNLYKNIKSFKGIAE